jgi:ketosteroid isomerase-like protein
MKNIATLFILLLLTLVIAAPSVSTAAEKPRGPEEVVAAFQESLSRGDRAGVIGVLAPDVVIFESGGAELSRDEYASHHLGADMEFSKATKREVIDRKSGAAEDAAWVLTRSRTSGTFRDKQVDLNGTETMLLRKTGDGWRIVHIHWSSAKAQ